MLTENAKPGQTFDIDMFVVKKPTEAPGEFRQAYLVYDILKTIDLQMIGLVESVSALDVTLPLAGGDVSKWKTMLDDASSLLNVDALQHGKLSTWHASWRAFASKVAPLSERLKRFTMYLISYSHIDPAWLWPKAEGKHVVVPGTSEGTLEVMNEHPALTYTMNQMHCYRWLERHYPQLFERVLEKVREGRWEAAGAQWVESDSNLPSGESFVRQYLYGRRYSKEKLGVVSDIGWTPDSFGYNWNLPQLLKKSGFRGFVTQKLSWNDTTKFPHHVFWWQAPDGSRVLVLLPQGNYDEKVLGKRSAEQLARMHKENGLTHHLVIFGMGDHGGGIPRDFTKRGEGLAISPLYPKMKFTTMSHYFDLLEKADKSLKFPTWNGELYLQRHRGTYTTQAQTKSSNRRNENALLVAEKFGSLAEMVTGHPQATRRLEEAWKLLLFNQFHDILPGSSIPEVYRDAREDYSRVSHEATDIRDDAFRILSEHIDTSGTGMPVVLFNDLAWRRDGLATVPLPNLVAEVSVFDDQDRPVTSQIVPRKNGNNAVVFVARDVPPMGFVSYRIIEWQKGAPQKSSLNVSRKGIENEFVRIGIDQRTGTVTSLFDKRLQRELAKGKEGFVSAASISRR